jgi:hypothetical protein
MDPTPEGQLSVSVNPTANAADVTFSHTEFIQNIHAPGRIDKGTSSAFHVNSYPINVGQEGT